MNDCIQNTERLNRSARMQFFPSLRKVWSFKQKDDRAALIVLMFAVASLAFGCVSRSQLISQDTIQGVHQLADGVRKKSRGDPSGAMADFNNAIAEFDRTIEESRSDERAWRYRGLAKSLKGNWDGAIADYDHAIELNPRDEDAYHWRGAAELKVRNWDGSIADYSHAIELKPQSLKLFQLYQGRAGAETQKGNSTAAQDDYNKALELVVKSGVKNTLSVARKLVEEGATSTMNPSSTEERYCTGIYLKLLADEQWRDGFTTEAQQTYTFAYGNLTAARDEFIKGQDTDSEPTARTRSNNSSSSHVWLDVGLFVAEVAADVAVGAMGGIQTHNIHLQQSQMFALSHAKTMSQYNSIVHRQMNLIRETPIQVTVNPAPISPESSGTQVAEAPTLGPRTRLCNQLLNEIHDHLQSVANPEENK
jgi:tetratricopeptide (TPR) repeat protein